MHYSLHSRAAAPHNRCIIPTSRLLDMQDIKQVWRFIILPNGCHEFPCHKTLHDVILGVLPAAYRKNTFLASVTLSLQASPPTIVYRTSGCTGPSGHARVTCFMKVSGAEGVKLRLRTCRLMTLETALQWYPIILD